MSRKLKQLCIETYIHLIYLSFIFLPKTFLKSAKNPEVFTAEHIFVDLAALRILLRMTEKELKKGYFNKIWPTYKLNPGLPTSHAFILNLDENILVMPSFQGTAYKLVHSRILGQVHSQVNDCHRLWFLHLTMH